MFKWTLCKQTKTPHNLNLVHLSLHLHVHDTGLQVQLLFLQCSMQVKVSCLNWSLCRPCQNSYSITWRGQSPRELNLASAVCDESRLHWYGPLSNAFLIHCVLEDNGMHQFRVLWLNVLPQIPLDVTV